MTPERERDQVETAAPVPGAPVPGAPALGARRDPLIPAPTLLAPDGRRSLRSSASGLEKNQGTRAEPLRAARHLVSVDLSLKPNEPR